MNPPDQPTPRTQAVWKTHCGFSNEDEATEAVCDFRDLSNTLERELAAAKAECERLKFALVEWEAKERGWSKAVEKDAAELTRLRAEVERLTDIINRASVQFFHDGSDGETAAKMLTVLNEAKP
jgi:hypothetical protein